MQLSDFPSFQVKYSGAHPESPHPCHMIKSKPLIFLAKTPIQFCKIKTFLQLLIFVVNPDRQMDQKSYSILGLFMCRSMTLNFGSFNIIAPFIRHWLNPPNAFWGLLGPREDVMVNFTKTVNKQTAILQVILSDMYGNGLAPWQEIMQTQHTISSH